jgi:hypothetical protein
MVFMTAITTQLESKTKKHLKAILLIRNLVLSIGLFSFLISCNPNQELSNKDKLVNRFYNEYLVYLSESNVFVIITPSNCDDCIKGNIELVKKWNKGKNNLHFIVDTYTYNYLKDYLDFAYFKVNIMDKDIFIKYDITSEKMLFVYSKDKKIINIERLNN